MTEKAALAEVADDASVEGASVIVLRVVGELNALSKSATLEFALAVGELVVRRLYGGDVARFRSRKAKDDRSLRRVAMHPDLAMSASMLYGCVATHEICERLGIRGWRHVSTSHIRLVLPLAHESQAVLLRDAESNRWPVKRLEEEVEALSERRERRGGRVRRSPLARALCALDRNVHALTATLARGDNLSARETAEALETLQGLVEACRMCEQRLQRTS